MKRPNHPIHDLKPLGDAERSDRLPKGMEARLHRALATQRNQPRVRSVWTGSLGYALVGTLAVVVLCVTLIGLEKKPQPVAPTQLAQLQPAAPVSQPIRIKLGEEMVLNVNFTAETAMEDVDFLIELPKGLRFATDDPRLAEANALEWEGSLESGPNAVPIMIYGSQPGRWTLRAQVRRDGIERLEIIELEVENGA